MKQLLVGMTLALLLTLAMVATALAGGHEGAGNAACGDGDVNSRGVVRTAPSNGAIDCP